MRATTFSNARRLGFAAFSIVAAAALVVSWLTVVANASGVVSVTSNIADVPNGDNFVLTVGVHDEGDVHELEVDHSLQSTLPEFSVYADEADPYGGDGTQFAAAGVTVTYSAADSQWVIDFGDTITQAFITAGGKVTFYLGLRDAAGTYLWGGMSPTTPENRFTFNLLDGTGDSLAPEAIDDDSTDTDPVVPGVPDTAIGRL